MDELRFDGRVAIITGAGGGLGRSHALALAARGASVLVNDLGGALDGSGSSTSAAEQVVEEIVALGGVASPNHDSVATALGGEAIVQSALDAAMIDQVIDVHLKGALYVCQPAFRLMRAQGYGRVVNTSSASGLFGNFGQANYGAAKAGLAGLTRVLALEGAEHGIKVNAIAPIALTRMTEGILGDLAPKVSTDSVSPLVVYLASDECAVNGNIYSVAGGRVARIFVGETHGVVFAENTPEAIRASLQLIDELDVTRFHEPSSLDSETITIAKALSEAS